jgi:hypothetical protein
MKGHRVALGGSFSGDTSELFNRLPQDDILQFSLIGREVTLQVKSERLDEVIKSLNRLGVDNINILEWRKYGSTLAGSGSGTDEGETISVSLIPSALGNGMRPLSVAQKVKVDRKVYVRLLANIEVVLLDAGVSDVLYVLHIEKEASKERYVEAVKDATLNAIFNAGGVVGLE